MTSAMKLAHVLLALTVIGGARPARAESVAILDLRFEGLAPAVIEPVRQGVRDALISLGCRVVDEAATRHLLREVPPGCSVGPCLARVGRVVKVDRVLVGAVASQGSSYELTFTLLETGGGTVLAQVNRRCDVCNFHEVEVAAGRAAETLQRQAQVAVSLRSSLTVRSIPAGAQVVIDGLPQGPAPVRSLLAPGRHQVEGVTRDLAPLLRRLELSAGEARTLTLNLIERQDEQRVVAPAPRGPRCPAWLKWALLGGGVALAGPGAVLWAVDGRPSVDERTLLDSRAAGITLVSLGAAAVVAGAVVAIVERR
jgi:hypothetical protein